MSGRRDILRRRRLHSCNRDVLRMQTAPGAGTGSGRRRAGEHLDVDDDEEAGWFVGPGLEGGGELGELGLVAEAVLDRLLAVRRRADALGPGRTPPPPVLRGGE